MKKRQKKDVFAEIAAREQSLRQTQLVEPGPAELPEQALPPGKPGKAAAFRPMKKMDTPMKLQRELDRQRRRYAKFMKDLAPAVTKTRIQLPITTFDWRKECPGGKTRWEKVNIPHYGGPLGRAVTTYRTTFTLSKAMLDKGAVFVCFKGVDYKAHVFVNENFVGSHEGFFAPFEFDITPSARQGKNGLLVRVENDAICMGNDSWGEDGEQYEGDKIYAATGPGYDEPEVGWHHCPPGMGIYQDVFIEARPGIHVHDIFVRPCLEEKRAEAWIEIVNTGRLRCDIAVELSVFGQNFQQTLFRNRTFDVPYAGPGVNYYRLPFDVPHPKLWEPHRPYLYQVQAKVIDLRTKTSDTASRQFGMRSFRMDETSEPKGRFTLNGRELRLRGANTMGHLQQCVMKKDWDQLRDDILLAKICHINFLRLTQRPVQREIYEFCDRLGLMTQTDLPLFGVLRRNQFTETVRQAGEMERLVRSHPCNIMVTYINEPFPGAREKQHRHLTRPELERFFESASHAVRLANPDRVIKPVDGDYDPPGPGLPDNHCYCGWYNGHGVDLGRLHKGYWQKVKPGWFYGCGEFGAEGLDPVEVMRKYYPPFWLPETPEEEKTWTPDRIVKAQTGRFHYMWFDTQYSPSDWAEASLNHQAWVTRLMTEAFRRDARMNTIAIHLFIDAFPSGWMKAIMDVDRRPKPAYFVYRDALTPLTVQLRTDRYGFFSGDSIRPEAWICNDLDQVPKGIRLHYQLEIGGKILFSNRTKARIPCCSSAFAGFLQFKVPKVSVRAKAVVRLGLIGPEGKVLSESHIELDLFPALDPIPNRRAFIVGSRGGEAEKLAECLGLQTTFSGTPRPDDVILIDEYSRFDRRRAAITEGVRRGARAVLLDLPEGRYDIADGKVTVTPCGMGARHFVSHKTGHPMVADFAPNDFRFWYDENVGYVTPLLKATFTASGWTPILTSGNGQWQGEWRPCLAAAEKTLGAGRFRLCQLSLGGRIRTNPTAMIFARRIISDG